MYAGFLCTHAANPSTLNAAGQGLKHPASKQQPHQRPCGTVHCHPKPYSPLSFHSPTELLLFQKDVSPFAAFDLHTDCSLSPQNSPAKLSLALDITSQPL